MFKKLKYHIIIFIILGYLSYVPQYLKKIENFDLVQLISNLFITYLIWSSITILVGLITYLISKNSEKTIKYTKNTMTVTIIFMLFIIIMNSKEIF